jgi:hypothetical protein
VSPPARPAPLLLALALTLAACHRRPPDPASLPPVAVVQDFERDFTLKRWPRDGPGAVTFSTEWSADGERSLRLDAGLMGSFEALSVTDWTGYQALRFTVHNPGARTAGLGVEIQDDHPAFDDRHQHSFGAPPGDHVIELDFSGGLWRGEENRPYRGSVKTPLDVSRVTRLAFVNRGAGPLHVDRLELLKIPPLATPGGFAFDFGRAGKQVMGRTTGVFETTQYTPAQGFGFLGTPGSIPRAMSYPTPLLGDGLSFPDEGFRVDLPGGAYLGWVAFERGGFWEDEQSGYAHADLLVNGAVVTGHDFAPGAPHFLFEDLELTDLAQIEEKLVRPAHAITRFRFQAAAGADVFTVRVTAPGKSPLRVAGLLLAPDTPAGAAFLDAHEQRQREAIAASYPPEDRGRRGPGRAPPASDLVAEPLPAGAPVYPRDLPEHPGAPPREVLAVPGQAAVVELALYAQRDLAIHASVLPLAGPGCATLPPPVVLHGRYLPTRPLGNGPVWLEVSHFRPDPDAHVAPDLARAVVLEWRIPRGAAPGLYTGAALFTAAGLRLEVPLRVRVFAIQLPPLPVPVCLFMSALPFGPEIVGEARWWELQEALLDEQASAGLTCVSGGTGLDFQVQRDGPLTLAGARPLRYLDLAVARGITRAAVAYNTFLQPGALDARAFAGAWSTFAEAHHLPPFFFPLYDEPATPEELAHALAAVRPFTEAGLQTMGFGTRRSGEPLFDALFDATYAPVLNGHAPGDLADLRRRGRHPWVYNSGLDRYGMGLHLWRNLRAGAEGRLEWIGLITQGFAFDDLDGREPSATAWLVHDRLGLLPTPRWLAAREGLLDARIRLALEAAAPAGDAAPGEWTEEGYGTDRARWDDAALSAARARMLERLERRP